MYITEAEIDSLDRITSNKHTDADLAAMKTVTERLHTHQFRLQTELLRIQEIAQGLALVTEKTPVPREYRKPARMWISKMRTELKDNAVVLSRNVGVTPPAPEPKTEPARDHLDIIFVDCHLELRNLAYDELCGRCGHAACLHKNHKTNRHRD